jgi:putative phage-type endonuclease
VAEPALIDRTAEVTAFADAARWTGITVDDRDAWLTARRGIITASDVPAILGEDEHRSAWDVYVDKVNAGAPEAKLELDDPRFWGTVLEWPIAQAVANHNGWQIRKGGALLVSREHPFIGCTLDAELLRDEAEGWIAYEGKTTRLPRGWDEESNEIPTRVLIQAQTQLLVTRAPRDYVFGLLQGSRPARIEVTPYPEFQELIVRECRAFMELVQAGTPPPADAKSGRAIARLYPGDDGSSVRLPDEALDWTRRLADIAEELKRLEAEKEELRNMLKVCIGSATFGELPEPVNGKGQWKWGTRAGYVVERHEVEPTRVLTSVKGFAPSVRAARREPLPIVTLASLPDSEVVARFRGRRRNRR